MNGKTVCCAAYDFTGRAAPGAGRFGSGQWALVEKAVRMERDMGREPASADEARVLLGLEST